jgi:hypothetical protein
MNLIQFKQVQGLDAEFAAKDANLNTLSGYLDGQIFYLMTGNNTFTGNKTFKDDVVFLNPVTGTSSGNFQGGLWVGTDQVLTTADTGNFVANAGDQNITGVKTFQGGTTNTIHQGGIVYIKQWGTAGEPTVGLRITGELWITGADGSALQLTNNSPWSQDGGNVYYGAESGQVGIGTNSPLYTVDARGTGSFEGLKITGGGQSLFPSIGVGTGAVNYSSPISTWGRDNYGVTGLEVVNESIATGSFSTIRLVCDTLSGAGNFGAVDIGAQREDSVGTSSFTIKTKTGIVADAGFDTRFMVSGAAILLDWDSLPESNPEVRGQLWRKPKSSTPGSSYLLISSGAAP